MINLLKQYTEGKNVLILGFGREGKSTYKRLCEAGGFASVTIADQNEIKDELPADVKIISGDSYQDTLNDYDIVFKSPGVVLKNDFASYTCKITSQTEIFLERFASNVIGITGTKGKSTTTTLIHHILSENGVDFEYRFTDVSNSFIAAAKTAFEKYPNVKQKYRFELQDIKSVKEK